MKNHANIAAAQSTAATLAVATLRSLNNGSGISGDFTRDSISRIAAARIAMVRGECQPASWPFTMAYTASISDAVMVIAPDTSSFLPLAVPGRCGSNLRQATYTPAPIGRFTRKIQCQF